MALPDDYQPAVGAPATAAPDSHAFAFRGGRLLVFTEDKATRLPSLAEVDVLTEDSSVSLHSVRRQHLGRFRDREVVSLELHEASEAPAGMGLVPLRALFFRIEEELFWIAARAVQIVAWDRDHQICGRCGTATQNDAEERSKKCPSCSLSYYPRLSPAVIVLVERDDSILLARSPYLPEGMLSTLAGFVEPGETLEQTVAREIEEEVGIRVENIRYFGSQPWPFPNSLMIGFRADWAGGEIVIDPKEIEAADWFTLDNLPKIPPRISIARALIDSWIAEQQ
ncbi:MAG: NAD(+) diphosphatase [Acidobacteriota bacterium]